MQKWNKAYAGSLGAACALVLVWLIESLGGIAVPTEIAGALTIILSGAGPAVAPKNKE